MASGNEDEDLKNLWLAERDVFLGEYQDKAKEWREKKNLPIGMGILFYPVVGRQFNVAGEQSSNVFCPLVAGSAYTSYRGKPLVRPVLGFGSKAVLGKAPVFTEAPDVNQVLRSLERQERLDAVSFRNLYLNEMPVSMIDLEINLELAQAVVDIFAKLEKMKQGGHDFYLEWAIGEDGLTTAVQCAPYIDKENIPIEIDTQGKILLASGTDIVNHGYKRLKHIILAGNRWDKATLAWLRRLNNELSDSLLIAPQKAFSMMAGGLTENLQISFEHFSKAGAILERQARVDEVERQIAISRGVSLPDHTDNKGGAHFQQLCDRADILFLEAEFDISVLENLPGVTVWYDNVRSWEIDVDVVNDMTKGENGEGYVYLVGEPKVSAYTITQVERFADILWDTSHDVGSELENDFYWACYATTPWRGNPQGFDPFAIEPAEIESLGGLSAIITSIEVVLREGINYFDDYEWEDLEEFLQELLKKLKEQAEQEKSS